MPVSIPIFILRDFTPVQIKVFSVLKGSLAIVFLLFQFKCRVDNREVADVLLTQVFCICIMASCGQKKKRVREILSSTGNGIYSGGFQSGNPSYVIRRYFKSNNGVQGRCVTCRKSMSRYHAWSLNPMSHCQTAVNFKNNVRAAT